MFKSVFTKYITTFMLIIFISFIVLTSIITSLINSYAVNQKEVELKKAAHSMSVFTNQSFTEWKKQYDRNPGYYDSIIGQIETENPEKTNSDSTNPKSIIEKYTILRNDDIQTMISVLASNIEGLIIIISDTDGEAVLAGNNIEVGLTGKKMPYLSTNKLNAGYEDSQLGNLSGFFDDRYLVYAVPVQVDGLGIIGSVLACTYNPEMDELLDAMIKTIIMSSLWIMLAALVAVYFISEKIISPLKTMSRAAKKFAAGQFDVRVPVTGKDEVAELATAFNNMADSLATQDQMRTTFLANVSHDLRTPMTTIAGFIDNILAGAIPPEKYDYYLGVIASEVRRLSRLVSSLLDISRMQAGERKFNMQPFDICELARQILISFEQKIDDKNLDVEFICDKENMTAIADRDAIHQVLYNICDNGIKFSKKGGKYYIKIVYDDRKIKVSVFNEGTGIPPEDVPYVFDRFYKSDKSRGLDKTGVGLGLFICKTIIEAHGEEIRVESVYGESCCFTFTLQSSDNK